MGAPMDDTHFTIRIPKFSGYKTLFVNGAVLAIGVIAALYPQIADKPIDPATVGLFYDSVTGGIVALIGFANICLRLVTTKPVPGMAKSVASGGNDAGEAFTQTHLMLSAALAGSSASVHMAGLHMPVADAIAMDRELNAPCHWPTCSCHQPCAERRATIRPDQTAAARIVDELCDAHAGPVVQLTTEERRRSRVWSGMRIGVASFMLGFVALTVPFLGGCASVQEVNAVAAADTLEQRAFALYGSFVVVEEQAAVLVRDKAVPKSVRKAVQAADAKAKPLADRLRTLAIQLNAARMAYNADPLGENGGRILAVTQAIGATLAAFEPVFRDLKGAVANAKGG